MPSSTDSRSVEIACGTVPAVSFRSGDPTADAAWRIALGDLAGNIVLFKDGLLTEERPVVLAGLDYDTPWTRDAAINVWNAAGIIPATVARDTLWSVVERTPSGVRIGGQYWDAIIWVVGAWQYWLYHADREFLALAFEASANSLAYFEETEYDRSRGLFRGPAVYGDGVSAYPARYVPRSGKSGILDWAHEHRDRSLPGWGIPMFALSTNCVYLAAYETAVRMARALGRTPDASWERKAQSLRRAIRLHFYDRRSRRLRYLVDAAGGCARQEALGGAFAVLTGVVPRRDRPGVIRAARVTPQGIACVYPTYARYRELDPEGSYGRHSGTVWPHAQGVWAMACAHEHLPGAFDREFAPLARNISRDAQCAEIYHPQTGKPYGGWQEDGSRGIVAWASCRRQTWTATAYLRMCIEGLAGIRVDERGMRFAPCLPQRFRGLEIKGLRYRAMTIDVLVDGTGTRVASCTVNGRPADLVPASGVGRYRVVVKMHGAVASKRR